MKKVAFLCIIVIIAFAFNSCEKDEPIQIIEVQTYEELTTPNLTFGAMTDQEGNEYKTIKIGTQTWMAENLRTTKYRNGNPILDYHSETGDKDRKTAAYIGYDRYIESGIIDDIDDIDLFGKLYNWFAVDDENNLAPTGWHIPTSVEWTVLLDYLGGTIAAGGKLKETGTVHWSEPNAGATNESGFTALPGGCNVSTFSNFKSGAFFWTASESLPDHATSFSISYNSIVVGLVSWPSNKTFFRSVRCVKD